MWVIRDVLTLAVVFLVLLFGVVMHVIVWIIEKISGSRPTKLISGYVRGGMKLAWLMTGAKATVIGTENIPTDRAALFVGNHRSLLDVILAGSLIPVPVGFIAKIELEKIPLLGFLMTDIDCLFLDRTDNRQALKVILRAIELMKKGHSMFVFPEGTRSKTEGEFLPFHAGSFKIATNPKAPIVPVTIVGMGDVLEDHFPKIKAARVVIEFGAPIETDSLSRDEQKELSERVRNLMMETYARNKELI